MEKERLIQQLNAEKTKLEEPLASYVGLKIGGPAEILYLADGADDLVKVSKIARECDVPVTVIGGGTNILVSDKGIRGLVIVNVKGDIKIGEEVVVEDKESGQIDITYRWESDNSQGTFRGIEFKDLDYDESNLQKVEVVMDSGVNLPYALYYLIEQGLTGLQWYAGIPGTIGGAVFNNIHGGTHFISEVVKSVDVMDAEGNVKTLTIEELGADYDRSRFHKSKEVILRATFNMYHGDKEKAMYVAKEWAKRKAIQPRNSPGCAFANLTQEQKISHNYPTTSAGYIIEHVLKMTGFKIGDAAISPDHHNFIINLGKATAADYLSVVKTIYNRTKEETGIILVPEIFFLGFEPEEIKEFTSSESKELRDTRLKEIKTVYKKKN